MNSNISRAWEFVTCGCDVIGSDCCAAALISAYCSKTYANPSVSFVPVRPSAKFGARCAPPLRSVAVEDTAALSDACRKDCIADLLAHFSMQSAVLNLPEER